MLVTKRLYPRTHAALRLVERDTGGAATQGDEPFDVVDAAADDMATTEAALAALDRRDFKAFCTGTATEQQAIASRSPALGLADRVLMGTA